VQIIVLVIINCHSVIENKICWWASCNAIDLHRRIEFTWL